MAMTDNEHAAFRAKADTNSQQQDVKYAVN